MATYELLIDGDRIIGLYNDAFKFHEHGHMTVERASNIEWFMNNDGSMMGWMVMSPAGDPWSCSHCFGEGTKKMDPCGCCHHPDYCERCQGLGFELFENREEALAHENMVLNHFLDQASESCEFDPFGVIGGAKSKGTFRIRGCK